MVFLAILVLGVASYLQLPVDQLPKMDPPYLTVMATYPGANASDIEENVTKILEDQLNSVDDLKELTSTSYDNLAVISLEFEWEANLDEASNDVRDAVDKAMQDLPDDIDRPTIMRFNTSMIPMIIDSARGMLEARKARGESFRAHPFRSVSELAASILSDLLDKAEVYTDALMSRGYDASARRVSPAYHRNDWIIIAACAAILAGMLIRRILR